jgi:hypothetical protein
MDTAKENVTKATAWLDDKLVPILGPAPLGPYELDERDDPNPGVADQLCPVCHHAMSRHEIEVDPRTHHTYLVCPGLGAAYEVHRHEEGEPGTQTGPVLS